MIQIHNLKDYLKSPPTPKITNTCRNMCESNKSSQPNVTSGLHITQRTWIFCFNKWGCVYDTKGVTNGHVETCHYPPYELSDHAIPLPIPLFTSISVQISRWLSFIHDFCLNIQSICTKVYSKSGWMFESFWNIFLVKYKWHFFQNQLTYVHSKILPIIFDELELVIKPQGLTELFHEISNITLESLIAHEWSVSVCFPHH